MGTTLSFSGYRSRVSRDLYASMALHMLFLCLEYFPSSNISLSSCWPHTLHSYPFFQETFPDLQYWEPALPLHSSNIQGSRLSLHLHCTGIRL